MLTDTTRTEQIHTLRATNYKYKVLRKIVNKNCTGNSWMEMWIDECVSVSLDSKATHKRIQARIDSIFLTVDYR